MNEKPYSSNFSPNNFVQEKILKLGNITAPNETASQMIERIVSMLYAIEVNLSDTVHANIFAEAIGKLIDERKIVFSTPVMTNAGRTDFKRPLSACTVPPLSLRDDLNKIRKIVDTYHQEAMGTGFNLDEVDDPVSTLLFLNDIATQGAVSNKENRPVGNIGICSIDHPRIVDFITSKQICRNMLWKFNISVNTPESFWFAVQNDASWRLRNGETIYAKELFRLIVQSAYVCADPGLIFMERINLDNPVPCSGAYHGVAPCAEVGLVQGETCQFGYINLGAFCCNGKFNLDEVKTATKLMVRALDDCLEISIAAYSVQISAEVTRQRRKIGVGVCGLADALILLGMPYASERARAWTRDVIAFINYQSKLASHKLAKKRGSFEAMRSPSGCRYTENPDFLNVKYGQIETSWVSRNQWKQLGVIIKNSQQLRNSSTIALPPTGRSGLVIEASTGIEPIFSLVGPDGLVTHSVKKALGSLLKKEREQALLRGEPLGEWCNPVLRELLHTSVEIGFKDHLWMVAALQPVVDESISKTINLPADVTIKDIEYIYMQAYLLNLKGMTMYRDGASRFQPRKL